MLDDAQYGSVGRNTSRPRSEGHKYLSAFANKRASSYAVSLPLSKGVKGYLVVPEIVRLSIGIYLIHCLTCLIL